MKERVMNFTKPFRLVLRTNGDGEIIPEQSNDVYTGALSDLNGNVVSMFDVQPGELYTFGRAIFPNRKEIVACVGFVVHKIEETDVLQQNATATFYYVSY